LAFFASVSLQFIVKIASQVQINHFLYLDAALAVLSNAGAVEAVSKHVSFAVGTARGYPASPYHKDIK